MQASVCLWAVALAALLVVVYRRERSAWRRIAATVTVLIVGSAFSPVVNRGLASFVYRVISKPDVHVGFFGGPPRIASSILALAITGAVALCFGRK